MTRLLYIIRKFFLNLANRPLAALGSFLSLLLLFLLFDLIWITSLSVNRFYEGLISRIDIEVFLDNSVPDSTVNVIRDAIAGLDGIESIEYVGRDKARDKLHNLMGVDLLEGLDDNPLPRSLIIAFMPNYLNSRNLNLLNDDLHRLEGVTDIFYPSQWLEKAEFTRGLVSDILVILGCVIAVTVILYMVHNIILSVRTRTEELRQLKLLGAGPVFLVCPYLMEAVAYAVAASAAGWIAIYYGLDLLSFKNIEVILPHKNDIVSFCLIASGAGLLGAYIGIRREL
jgi:cell division transport system permease protein